MLSEFQAKGAWERTERENQEEEKQRGKRRSGKEGLGVAGKTPLDGGLQSPVKTWAPFFGVGALTEGGLPAWGCSDPDHITGAQAHGTRTQHTKTGVGRVDASGKVLMSERWVWGSVLCPGPGNKPSPRLGSPTAARGGPRTWPGCSCTCPAPCAGRPPPGAAPSSPSPGRMLGWRSGSP